MSSGSTRRATAIDQRNSSGGHGRALCIVVPGFGQEVLHDHFLHVAVAAVRCRDRLERLDAFGARLADADEDPGGERDAGASGGVERGQPALGCLVGRTGVRAAVVAEPGGQRLDHHPLRRADRPELFELGLRERTRVGVGEQTGFVEHEAGGVR